MKGQMHCAKGENGEERPVSSSALANNEDEDDITSMGFIVLDIATTTTLLGIIKAQLLIDRQRRMNKSSSLSAYL